MKLLRFISITICMLLVFSIVTFAGQNDDYMIEELEQVIEKYDLKTVDTLPEGIVPIIVEDELELEALLIDMKQDFDNQELGSETSSEFDINPFNINYNKRYIDKYTVFNLSSIGGKIVVEVSYFRSNMSPYSVHKDYHDVYESGAYIFQEITYNEKSCIQEGANLKVRVRGMTKIYIGISGGGASGNVVLKEYRFDESYRITPY